MLVNFIVFSLLATAAVPSPPTPIEVVLPGLYHGSEMPFRTSSGWIAVVCGELGCVAEPASIRTEFAHDEIVDTTEHEKTGVEVTASTKQVPLFLVRGFPVVPQRVMTILHQRLIIEAGDMKSLRLLSAPVVLTVEGQPSATELLPDGTKLLLKNENTSQVIYQVGDANDAHIELLWAGDIDGDQKLDFLVDADDHYNVSSIQLFLSSKAKKGALVGLAAVLTTTGC